MYLITCLSLSEFVLMVPCYYLGCPVGLGHFACGRDGVSEYSAIIGNPGTTDSLLHLEKMKHHSVSGQVSSENCISIGMGFACKFRFDLVGFFRMENSSNSIMKDYDPPIL